MSWCRWGSDCSNTIPVYKVDEECVARGCPGSALYIYEGSRGLVCCCGDLSEEEPMGRTPAEMYEHILEHDRKGEHVRRSLLYAARNGGARPELTDDWKQLYEPE